MANIGAKEARTCDIYVFPKILVTDQHILHPIEKLFLQIILAVEVVKKHLAEIVN